MAARSTQLTQLVTDQRTFASGWLLMPIVTIDARPPHPCTDYYQFVNIVPTQQEESDKTLLCCAVLWPRARCSSARGAMVDGVRKSVMTMKTMKTTKTVQIFRPSPSLPDSSVHFYVTTAAARSPHGDYCMSDP
jgi:hypothetical protein